MTSWARHPFLPKTREVPNVRKVVAMILAMLSPSLLTGCERAPQVEAKSAGLGEDEHWRRTLDDLRAISRASEENRAEDFIALAERELHAPSDVAEVLRAAQEGRLSDRDLKALAEFARLALQSYGAARRTHYYGPNFDPSGFVDVVVETLPALPFHLANALMQALNEQSFVTADHAWMFLSLASVSELRVEAWRGLLGLYRGEVLGGSIFLDFASASGGDPIERSLRAEIWCALLEREPVVHTHLAQEILARDDLDEYECASLLQCAAQFGDPQASLAFMKEAATAAVGVDSRMMEAFQKLGSTSPVAEVERAFDAATSTSARCLFVAAAHSDHGFLGRVLVEDPDEQVAAWAAFFLFNGQQWIDGRISVARRLAERIDAAPAASEVRIATDRLLVMLEDLRNDPTVALGAGVAELADFVGGRVSAQPGLKARQAKDLVLLSQQLAKAVSQPVPAGR